MHKHIVRSVLTLTMIFGLVLGTIITATLVHAQEPLNNWFTSVTFQNVTETNNDASVQIEAYGSSGSPVTPNSPVTIQPGANQVFLPGFNQTGFIDMDLPSGFQGGIVASSSEPIVAISQVGNNPVGSNGVQGGAAIGQYRGTGQTDTTISYPLAKNGFGNKVTVFSIQAAGGDVEYTATINANNGTTHTKTGSIEANRTALLLPSTFSPALPGTGCGTDVNTTPCLGSLVVEATGGSGSLVGAVIETRSDVSIQNVGQAATMFTSGDGASTVYCPVVKYESGSNQNTSGVSVQNLGPGEVTVELTTALNAGGTGTSSLTIPEGAARVFFGPNVGFSAGNFGAGTIEVTSGTGQIIAAVNESNVTVAGLNSQKQVTYTCFSADQATDTIAFPLVKERFGIPAAATSINLQNIGPSDVTASVEYVCDTGTVSAPLALEGNGGGGTLFLNSGVPSNSNCAATATAPSGSQIIGLSQDTSDLGFAGGSDSALDLRNYEGFNQ